MASPSAEGLTKSEIKQRLAEVRKQYEHMQKKLEKSDKASRAKSHVKKRIADYKLKQKTGGSPECTTSYSAKSAKKDTNTPHGSPADQEGRLLVSTTSADQSSTWQKASGKKKSKRRSVSFSIANDPGRSGVREVRVPNHSPKTPSKLPDKEEPTHHLQKRECHPKALPTDGRTIPNTSVKSKIHNVIVEADGPYLPRNQSEGQFLTAKHVGVSQQPDHADATPTEVVDYGMHKENDCVEPDVEELSSPCEAKTPPEDTQFDLFADSEPQDDPLGGTGVPLSSIHSNSNVSRDKMATPGATSEYLSTPGHLSMGAVGKEIVKCLDASFDNAEDLSNAHKLGEYMTVAPSDTVVDKPYSVVTSAITSDNSQETQPAPCDIDISDSVSSTVVKGHELKSDKSSKHMTHSAQELTEGDSSDDPDIIPGPYSDGESTRNTISATSRKRSLVQSVTKEDGFGATNFERNTEKQPIHLSPEPCLTLKEPSEFHRDSLYDIHAGVTTEPNRTDNAELFTSEVKGITDIEQLHSGLKGEQDFGENVQRFESESSSSLNQEAESPLEDLLKSNPQVGRKMLAGKMGKQKGRRRTQKNFDNLSMDDLRLKDFVLSQQNSQEGTHSWIDGLVYPAEYYVRKTRSMSKYSPNQHSAPVTRQPIARTSSNRRRGSLEYDWEKVICSEPADRKQEGYFDQKDVILGIDKELDPSTIVTSACVSLTSQEEDLPSQGACQVSEMSRVSKVKVSRKPAASRRKRGRKLHRRKMDPKQREDEDKTQQESKPYSARVVTTQDTCITSSPCIALDQGTSSKMDPQEEFPEQLSYFPGSDVSVMTVKEGDICGSYSITQGVEDLKFVHSTVNSNKRSIEKPSSTQVTHNPLESQFTQTQMPENFPLPTVFCSPGCITGNSVGLSPGSPSSPKDHTLQDAIQASSPVNRQTDSLDNNENTFNRSREQISARKEECRDEQWMSQAYLADVVPDLPNDNKCLTENSCLNPGNVTNLLFSDSQDDPQQSQEPIQGVNADMDRVSQATDVSMKSCASQTPQMAVGNPLPLSQDVIEDPLAASHHVNQTTDPLPECTPGVPSSLCSNLDQLSPFAGAATGTPPKNAEMPLAQSQCTDSLRGTQEGDRIPEDGMPEGHPYMAPRHCFAFKGCLEHGEEETSSIKCIKPLSVVINGETTQGLLVHSTHLICLWTFHTLEQDYQLLSSWRTAQDEEIVSTYPIAETSDSVEMVVILKAFQLQNIRYMRWDCAAEHWDEKTLLSREVREDGCPEMRQERCPEMREDSCPVACVLGNRQMAVCVDNSDGGSDVCVLAISMDEREEELRKPVYLPASATRLNSLTPVLKSPGMLLGMAESSALVWHVASGQLVREFDLSDLGVDHCIQATAESGLLFMVAYLRPAHGPADRERKGETPNLDLLVLNPANGRSSTLLNYGFPSIPPHVWLEDVFIQDDTLAACTSEGHICLWDLYSSSLLLTSSGGTWCDVRSVCLHDKNTLLLGSKQCVQVLTSEI